MKKIKTLLLCLLILVIGLVLARILILTAPEAERTKPQRQALLVETTSVALSDEHGHARTGWRCRACRTSGLADAR